MKVAAAGFLGLFLSTLLLPSGWTPAATVTAKPGEWPQWQGPNRDGISTETGLLQQWPEAGPELIWKATGLGQGFAGISIQNGRIYTMGEQDGMETVLALDLKHEGKILWCTPVGKLGDNAGKPGARCTPAADGDLVYALGSQGDLVCCEAATGNVVWKKNFPADFGGKMMSIWGFSESPLVDGDKLICTPGGKDATLVALNKKTGDEIWRCAIPDLGGRGKDGAGYSSVVISNGAGKKQYVQLVGRGLIGVSEDGKYLWGYPRIANQGANITTPLVNGDYIFTTTSYNTGSALLKLVPDGDGVKPEEIYFMDAKKFNNHHGGVVMVGDYIYGGNGQNQGFPTCIEWKTGKIVWGGKERGPGKGSAAVGYADGRLYFRYEDGTMSLLDASPDGLKVEGAFTIPDVSKPSWPHPVIADGKLYLREQDALLCYKVK
jgi:outer membrane protein assembly factor BamB